MRSSTVGNVPTSRVSLFELFTASQFPYEATVQEIVEQLKNIVFLTFSPLDRFGAMYLLLARCAAARVTRSANLL